MSKVEFELAVSRELGKKLSRVGVVLSRRWGRSIDLEEALDAMSEVFLERLDPERRTQAAIAKARARLKREPAPRAPRPEVPSALKLQALRRDRNQCTHVGADGVRCQRKKHIAVFPKVAARAARLEHFVTLCSQHRAPALKELAPAG